MLQRFQPHVRGTKFVCICLLTKPLAEVLAHDLWPHSSVVAHCCCCAQRQLFRTPFLVEGWALHWEMLLWDIGAYATVP
eukprot:COSAG02_NODE_23410_length_719_cov_2.338710_2_plen_78_part_01